MASPISRKTLRPALTSSAAPMVARVTPRAPAAPTKRPPVVVARDEMELAPDEAAALQEFLVAALAENTRRAYQRDWTDFCAWCLREQVRHLPASPETLSRYMLRLATHGPALLWNGLHHQLEPRPDDQPAPCRASTIRRRLASINRAHQANGFEGPGNHPIVRNLQQGIRRKLGTAPRKKAPATTDIVLRLIQSATTATAENAATQERRPAAHLQSLRDSALILVGFTGCFRRSELAGLEVSDFRFVEEGLEITVRRSKTDQEGRGLIKRLPFSAHEEACPVRAIKAWWSAAGITSGPAFRGIHRGGNVSARALTDRAVALIIKKLALRAGLDPGAFAGHSLRSGFATSAARAGANLPELMEQGGWKSERIALGYVQQRAAWDRNAALHLGL